MKVHAPIGVMDSGVGGLSVVCALKEVLPQENIIYYGDTANCPYGNKSDRELLQLSGNMLEFLESKGIKCLALACNTTSALADVLRQRFTTPIITVAECAADAIGKMGIEQVGLIATVSTVRSGIYERRIRQFAPGARVISKGSEKLAALVENHRNETALLEEEIRSCLDKVLEDPTMHKVILGCTHYPLIRNIFESLYPGVEFLDPAPYQAASVRQFLESHELSATHQKPTLQIFTTGPEDHFIRACAEHHLQKHYDVTVTQI